jgi:hypothetical protein
MAASHLHPYESASTPYLPHQPVDAAPIGDKRMDGRDLEQFRPICESERPHIHETSTYASWSRRIATPDHQAA